MGRPPKDNSDKLNERIEFRGFDGTKLLLEKLQKHHRKESIGALVRYLADKEAKRLKIEIPKPE